MSSSTTYPDQRCRELFEYYFGDASSTDCTLELFQARTKFWFFRNADVDATVRARFEGDVARAVVGDLDRWKATPVGRLGLIVLLDQFPRHIHRGSAQAFATDARALTVAFEGLDTGEDQTLTAGERLVFYLPLMHTEDVPTQRRCTELFAKLAEEGPAQLRPDLTNALKAAQRHREIIERFGRFPHRNETLGRLSTPEETVFLSQPNSSF